MSTSSLFRFLHITFYRKFAMSTDKEQDQMIALIDQRAEEARKNLPAAPTVEQEMAAMLGGGLLRELSTFKGTPLEVWSRIQEGSGKDTQKVSDMLNKRIDLVDFYCHEVDLENERTGEIDRKIRTVLYDANGTTVQCVSDGVAKDIWRIMQMGLHPSQDMPLAIMLVQIETRGGNRLYRIVPFKG